MNFALPHILIFPFYSCSVPVPFLGSFLIPQIPSIRRRFPPSILAAIDGPASLPNIKCFFITFTFNPSKFQTMQNVVFFAFPATGEHVSILSPFVVFHFNSSRHGNIHFVCFQMDLFFQLFKPLFHSFSLLSDKLKELSSLPVLPPLSTQFPHQNHHISLSGLFFSSISVHFWLFPNPKSSFREFAPAIRKCECVHNIIITNQQSPFITQNRIE